MPREPAGSPHSAAATWPPLARFVRAEAALGGAAAARGPLWGAAYEFLRFGMKQGWACLFGGALALTAIPAVQVAAETLHPDAQLLGHAQQSG